MDFVKKLLRRKENKGTAAIEFAILLPFLLLMFFGSFELSRYIIAVRKIENVTNDINFILSREGTIYDIDGNGSTSAGEDAGRLDRMTRALVPILMTPNPSDNYELEIRAVARPLDAEVSPDVARVMWSHKITNTSGANPASVSSSESGFTIVESTSSASGSPQPSSIYEDEFGERAELTFPGQTFLMINFASGYNQIINRLYNLVSLNLGDDDVEKVSTYAVRSRWFDDGDEVLQANEFYNEMQICLDCNVFQSSNLGGGAAGSACAEDTTARPNTSGCIFN